MNSSFPFKVSEPAGAGSAGAGGPKYVVVPPVADANASGNRGRSLSPRHRPVSSSTRGRENSTSPSSPRGRSATAGGGGGGAAATVNDYDELDGEDRTGGSGACDYDDDDEDDDGGGSLRHHFVLRAHLNLGGAGDRRASGGSGGGARHPGMHARAKSASPSALLCVAKPPSHRRAKSGDDSTLSRHGRLSGRSPSPSPPSSNASSPGTSPRLNRAKTVQPGGSNSAQASTGSSNKKQKQKGGVGQQLSEDPEWFQHVILTAKAIFQAKCQDMGKQLSEQIESRFVSQVVDTCQLGGRTLDLSDCGLGPLAIECVCKFIGELHRAHQEYVDEQTLRRRNRRSGADDASDAHAEDDVEADEDEQYYLSDDDEDDDDAKLHVFRTVNLSLNPMGDEGMEHVAELLRHDRVIRHVTLDSVNLTPTGFTILMEALEANDCVRSLSTSAIPGRGQMHMGRRGAGAVQSYVASSRKLLNLVMRNCGIGHMVPTVNKISKAVVDNTSLQLLDISSNKLFYRGACVLVNEVEEAGHARLDTLVLRSNSLGCAGAAKVACLLRTHDLTSIDLSKNGIGIEGFALVMDALLSNQHLRVLVLDQNLLSGVPGTPNIATNNDKGWKNDDENQRMFLQEELVKHGLEGVYVPPNLHQNHSLRTLSLRSCNIGDAFVTQLCSALAEHDSIVSLSLSRNLVTDEGAAALADMLGQMPVLESLDLEFNKVGSVGAMALAKSVSECKSFRSLSLSRNEVNEDAASFLYSVLKTVPTLCVLDVSGNHLNFASMQRITELAAKNKREYDAAVRARHLEQICALKQRYDELKLADQLEHPVMAEHDELVDRLEDTVAKSQNVRADVGAETHVANRGLTLEELKSVSLRRQIEAIENRMEECRVDWTEKNRELRAKIRQEQFRTEAWRQRLLALQEKLEQAKVNKLIGLDDATRGVLVLRKKSEKAQESKQEVAAAMKEVEQFIKQLEEEAAAAKSSSKSKRNRATATKAKKKAPAPSRGDSFLPKIDS